MNDSWMMILVLTLMVPIVFISTIIPFLTRRIESFGVTVPETAQQDPDIKGLRNQFIWINGGGGVLLTASLLIFSRGTDEKSWSILLLAHVFGYLILSFLMYLKSHYAVKRLKSVKGWNTESVQRVVVSTKFRNAKLTLSNFWFIPHVMLILATVLISVLYYDQFPAQIAMQYGMDGEVTRSVEKTYMAVMWPGIVQSFLLIVFLFCNYAIGLSKQIVEGSDPEGSLARNIKFRRIWSGYLIFTGFAVMALLALFPIGQLQEWGINGTMIATFSIVGVIMVSSIILSFVTGQGGSRLKHASDNQSQTVATQDLDQYWKMGQVYFNPKDPAIFVEKRFGIGWTLNFGNKLGWLFIIVIIGLSVSLPFIID
ncbi:DUF1648 domain-containing protein [Paenibacillus sp. 1011MAR3C5]|uniref:DUF1648 domain-containing protein n=1 Tax=Paenibacillus sp. 1011MAR3C5 TaxID=1675787 RepID=UPI000E6C2F33|nr:DUF5808 domain-containing protein [Paenibacillus sp. 1011MAR3C5]RJE88664.1 DUF1648 domain-containing protein [Paenibacillus sp. 1011MAR3C5]